MQLDGRQRFDNCIVGVDNRLAMSAARAVAESPGETYNPLFVRAASGLGKTHVLNAIGAQALAMQPKLRVDALTVDEFVRQLHAAVSAGDGDAFRGRFQHTDLLLIDDLQFLTGRRETQAALFHIVEYLLQRGRQIVVTSDRLPSDISDVDERLVAQFATGLVVEIVAPDYETRLGILDAWCTERQVELAPGVIEALGSIDVGSVRELQTALNRLIAHQNADGQGTPIDPDTVRMLFPARASGLTSGPDLESEPEAGFLDDPPFGDDVAPASEEESKPSEFFSFLSDVAHAVARHVGDPQTGEAADEAEVAPAAMGDAQREAPPAWLEDPAAVDDDRVPAAVNLVAHEGEPVADAYFLDDEKVLWDWPEITGRVIEDPR